MSVTSRPPSPAHPADLPSHRRPRNRALTALLVGGLPRRYRGVPPASDPKLNLRRSLIGVAVVAVPIVVLGIDTVAPRPTLAGFLGLLVVAICLAALYQIAVHGPFAPVAITFWAFVIVWVGLAPLLQIRDRHLPWKDTPLTQLYATAQLILLVAIVAFWLGYSRPSAAALRPTRHRFDIRPRNVVLMTAATLVLSAYSIATTGGLAVRFTSRDHLKAAITKAGVSGGGDLAKLGLLNTLPAAASLAALVLCLYCLRHGLYEDRRTRLALVCATGVAVVLNVIYNNPLSASRFAAFGVVLAVIVTLVDFSKPWLRGGFVSAMVFGLAVVYPLADLFRNEAKRSHLRLGASAYYTYDFDGFQTTVNAVDYTQQHGHTWGYHLISALMFWVPRSMWTDKARPAGIVVAENRGYTFQNLSLPLWAELFMEFWWVGVAVVFFGYGWLARRLDTVILAKRKSAAAVLTILVAACQIGFLRGSVGSQIPFPATAFIAATVCGLALRRRGVERQRLD
jgi:hypothetical protein